jgi:hypothetical protein
LKAGSPAQALKRSSLQPEHPLPKRAEKRRHAPKTTPRTVAHCGRCC